MGPLGWVLTRVVEVVVLFPLSLWDAAWERWGDDPLNVHEEDPR